MRAVTCRRGAPGKGSPPWGPPTPGGSGVPATSTTARRRVREGSASARLAQRPGHRASGGHGGCRWPHVADTHEGGRFRLSGSVQSFEDKHHVKGAGGDAWIR